ncbi:DNAH1, partial [Symbiodinium sp. KB8]
MESPDFEPKAVEKSSKACSGICMWVRAMYKYYHVAKEVEPKKQRLAEAQATLDKTLAELEAAKERLKAVEDRIETLEKKFNETQARKEQLAKDVEQCRARLARSLKLIGGLGGEKDRWAETVARLNVDYENLIGDALVSSSTIAYLGPFTSDFRAKLVNMWQSELEGRQLPHTKGCDVHITLADPVQVRAWNIAGLPSDRHSVENGIIMAKARRWPLLIDPQGQANRYIKNMGKDKALAMNGMDVVRENDKKFLQNLENGVRFGKWILLENIGEKLDAALEPLLLQQKFKQGGAEMIKLGDSIIPYNDSFRFFMTTKLPNPHYPPEVAVKVSLLNFTITPKGLEDQMLGVFVVNELPELEERKNTLTLSMAAMKKELQDLENKILFLLSNSEGNILDDEVLIDTLAQSKTKSVDITAKVEEAEVTEKEIDNLREKYRPVAYRASILYFCITDLSNVDPMYQYSLQWFRGLFENGIRDSEKAEEVEQRISNLNSYFTYLMYRNVCRSLFERHKLLFSFLMTIRIMQGDDLVDAEEWRYLISGQTNHKPEEAPRPSGITWLNERIWGELLTLNTLPAFKGLLEDFKTNVSAYQRIFDSSQAELEQLPTKWSGATMLQHMCLLRALRPDVITLSIQEFVTENLGKRFIEPPPFDLSSCFADSNVTTPLIFVLSTGSDPTRAFYTFADTVGMRSKVNAISLGQGQGAIAAALITEAQQTGQW